MRRTAGATVLLTAMALPAGRHLEKLTALHKHHRALLLGGNTLPGSEGPMRDILCAACGKAHDLSELEPSFDRQTPT